MICAYLLNELGDCTGMCVTRKMRGSEMTLEIRRSLRVSMSTSFQLPAAIFEPVYAKRWYF